MKISSVLSVCLFGIFAINSHGIIIRHDVAPGEYAVRSSEFPQVFFLEQRGNRKICGATLISAHWALTAAHCVSETLLGSTIEKGEEFQVEISNSERNIDLIIIHPDFVSQHVPEVDLALLHFGEEVNFPKPIPVNTESNELGEIITLVGWGYFGLGTVGRQYDDGSKRRAQNRVTRADQQLRTVFDDPRISGRETLPLEGTLGLGDSGGPAFLEYSEGLVIAGVSVGEVEGAEFSEESQGQYGSVAVFERLSIHAEWINSVINSDY